jgi:hypothetical protein
MSEEIYLKEGSGKCKVTEEGHSKLLQIHDMLKCLEEISNKNEALSYKIKLDLFGPEPKGECEDPGKEPFSIPNTLDGALRRLNIIHGSLTVNRNTLERIIKEL